MHRYAEVDQALEWDASAPWYNGARMQASRSHSLGELAPWFVLAVVACGPKPSDAPAIDHANAAAPQPDAAAPSAIAGPPAQWWSATETEGDKTRASTVRCAADELAFVDTNDRLHVRPATLVRSDVRRWEWSMSGPGSGITCVLDVDAAGHSGTLRCRAATATESFALAAVVDPGRAAVLDGLLARDRPSADVCTRAQTCGEQVFALIDPGSKFDPAFQFGDPPVPDLCQRSLASLVEIIAVEKLALPEGCR